MLYFDSFVPLLCTNTHCISCHRMRIENWIFLFLFHGRFRRRLYRLPHRNNWHQFVSWWIRIRWVGVWGKLFIFVSRLKLSCDFPISARIIIFPLSVKINQIEAMMGEGSASKMYGSRRMFNVPFSINRNRNFIILTQQFQFQLCDLRLQFSIVYTISLHQWGAWEERSLYTFKVSSTISQMVVVCRCKPKGNHKNGKKEIKKEDEIIETARLMTFHSDTIDARNWKECWKS